MVSQLLSITRVWHVGKEVETVCVCQGLASSKRYPENKVRVKGIGWLLNTHTWHILLVRVGHPSEPATMSHKLFPCACLHWSCSSWCAALKQEVQGDSEKRKDLDMAASVQG